MIGRLLAPRRARIQSYVFVFTYGRSGSTLLMGLLNSLPGYCIRGENNNALHALYEYDRRLHEGRASSLKNSERPTHPWFGLHRADLEGTRADIRESFTRRVLTPEPGHRVAGFKEIRFSAREVPDFDGYVDFVRATFAPCKIIFNHRDLDAVARSSWWSSMPEAPTKLRFMEDRFNGVPAAADIYHFSYDRLCADPGYARELMRFLGEPYDEAAVRQLLAVRHSY